MSIDAIRFVRERGIVLESAKGGIPNLAEGITGTPIYGSWWAHSEGRGIFQATRLVRSSERVLVCRLMDGKITYVDRRL